jgi:hypothetical protein
MTAIDQFWMDLYAALARHGIPMAKRTDRAADVGWGRGMRLLIDTDERISHPEGRFVPLKSVTAEGIAAAVLAAFRLTRREREVLGMIRSGVFAAMYPRSGFVTVGKERVRRSLIERLTSLGLVDERASEESADCELVAVQPESVNRWKNKR